MGSKRETHYDAGLRLIGGSLLNWYSFSRQNRALVVHEWADLSERIIAKKALDWNNDIRSARACVRQPAKVFPSKVRYLANSPPPVRTLRRAVKENGDVKSGGPLSEMQS